MTNPLQPVYKKVSVVMPHCPICGVQLQGNNSTILPYKCKCGEWKYDWTDTGYETVGWKIIKEK
jgi:hypothetical protein